MDQFQQDDQSTLIRNLPKDNIRNPDEARIVQSIINDNVEEMNNPALMAPQQMQGMFMQDPNSAMDMMPDFQQPKMGPGAMGGAVPMMQAPMPQQVPQLPMEQQQAMMQQQMMMQQAQQQAAAAQMAANMQEQFASTENEGFTTWMWNETKEPLFVSAVFFVLSMYFVKILFANYIPYMGNGWINLLVRSILAGLTVYFGKKFIL